MAAVGTLVGGALVTRPGVYPEVDASAMNPVQPGTAGTILVLGTSDGGDPSAVYTFRSYDEAASVIRGGRLLSYISRMFNPGPDRPGASVVKFIRSNTSIARATANIGNPGV